MPRTCSASLLLMKPTSRKRWRCYHETVLLCSQIAPDVIACGETTMTANANKNYKRHISDCGAISPEAQKDGSERCVMINNNERRPLCVQALKTLCCG